MINGHGDDLHRYTNILANFSSNVFSQTENTELLEHLKSCLPSVATSYPEPEAEALQASLAERLGLKNEEVLITNGATEAIYLIAQMRQGGLAHIAEPTFSEYRDACLIHGTTIAEDIQEPWDTLWLCNPNNPTGEVSDEQELIKKYLTNNERLIVVDRSYEYFCRLPLEQIVDHTKPYDQYLQIHSLTKRFRIPGIRLGYITGAKEWIDRLRAIRPPWAVNSLAIQAGKWIVEHGLPETIDKIRLFEEADWLKEQINLLKGYKIMDSSTHFMLIKTPHPAQELKDFLADRCGVLIRDASNFRGLSPNDIRIATQDRKSNELLIKGLKEYNRRNR